MLAENCPTTGEVPLMQDPVSGRKFSIALGKFTDEIEGEDAASTPAPASVPTPAPAAPAPPPPVADVAPAPTQPPPAVASPERPRLPPMPAGAQEAQDKSKADSDRWCEHMSQLMLKGWKMLGDNCPVTGQVCTSGVLAQKPPCAC
eukprot:1654018-Prymnesium_polylepis.1